MIKESFLKKLTPEHILSLLQERQEFAAKAQRALPRIDKKITNYPNWRAMCPKSGCELTLDIIKEELQAYLEETEEEIGQLQKHLKPQAKQKKLELIC